MDCNGLIGTPISSKMGQTHFIVLFMNLVLHSNFDIYMFYLVIFYELKDWLFQLKTETGQF